MRLLPLADQFSRTAQICNRSVQGFWRNGEGDRTFITALSDGFGIGEVGAIVLVNV
ncbi:MAG: hypothetical protein HC879_14960 [Leptolyngbyaceae cyanobacterium SL_5_9]|nr:hypothetical protein [Leptolyngbyaceae cyanobacterium SL_5_9]NJO73334.1 hypothetical protein [Leptolyngbyaceae cyanobacterium RM1_406_9]